MHAAVSNGSYDVERIRSDFPILAMQVYGKPLRTAGEVPGGRLLLHDVSHQSDGQTT